MIKFWENSFAYIFNGYQNFGEKGSAHIYAFCILSLALQCNLLSLMFLIVPFSFIKLTAFKIVSVVLFFAILAANTFFFLSKGRYLQIMIEYEKKPSEMKRPLIVRFWIYLIVTAGCVVIVVVN